MSSTLYIRQSLASCHAEGSMHGSNSVPGANEDGVSSEHPSEVALEFTAAGGMPDPDDDSLQVASVLASVLTGGGASHGGCGAPNYSSSVQQEPTPGVLGTCTSQPPDVLPVCTQAPSPTQVQDSYSTSGSASVAPARPPAPSAALISAAGSAATKDARGPTARARTGIPRGAPLLGIPRGAPVGIPRLQTGAIKPPPPAALRRAKEEPMGQQPGARFNNGKAVRKSASRLPPCPAGPKGQEERQALRPLRDFGNADPAAALAKAANRHPVKRCTAAAHAAAPAPAPAPAPAKPPARLVAAIRPPPAVRASRSVAPVEQGKAVKAGPQRPEKAPAPPPPARPTRPPPPRPAPPPPVPQPQSPAATRPPPDPVTTHRLPLAARQHQLHEMVKRGDPVSRLRDKAAFLGCSLPLRSLQLAASRGQMDVCALALPWLLTVHSPSASASASVTGAGAGAAAAPLPAAGGALAFRQQALLKSLGMDDRKEILTLLGALLEPAAKAGKAEFVQAVVRHVQHVGEGEAGEGLREELARLAEGVAGVAAAAGHEGLLEWLLGQELLGGWGPACAAAEAAAGAGRVEMLRKLLARCKQLVKEEQEGEFDGAEKDGVKGEEGFEVEQGHGRAADQQQQQAEGARSGGQQGQAEGLRGERGVGEEQLSTSSTAYVTLQYTGTSTGVSSPAHQQPLGRVPELRMSVDAARAIVLRWREVKDGWRGAPGTWGSGTPGHPPSPLPPPDATGLAGLVSRVFNAAAPKLGAEGLGGVLTAVLKELGCVHLLHGSRDLVLLGTLGPAADYHAKADMLLSRVGLTVVVHWERFLGAAAAQLGPGAGGGGGGGGEALHRLQVLAGGGWPLSAGQAARALWAAGNAAALRELMLLGGGDVWGMEVAEAAEAAKAAAEVVEMRLEDPAAHKPGEEVVVRDLRKQHQAVGFQGELLAKVERWVEVTPGKRQQGADADAGCGSVAAGLSGTDMEDLRIAAALVARDAAGRGDLWALKQLHVRGWRMTQGELGAAALAAASAGQAAVLGWMVSTFGTEAGKAVNGDAGGGAEQAEARAGGLGGPLVLSLELMVAAAETGSLPLMRRLHGWGCPLGLEVAAAAIKGTPAATRPADGGSGAGGFASAAVPLLQWLVDRGCVLAHTAVRVAAVRHGEVALLGWLDGRGCGGGWGAEELVAAAELGLGEVLVWLAARGAVKAYNAAVDRGQKGLLTASAGVGTQEADGGGGGVSKGMQMLPYRAAAAAGDVATLRCLQHLGVRVGAGYGVEGALPLPLLAPGVRAWVKAQRT